MSAISGTSTSAPRFARCARGDRAQVDLGLARAGDAVEQERRRARRASRAPRRSRVDRRRLLRLGELGRRRRARAASAKNGSRGASRSSMRDEPELDELLHRGARAAELLLEARDRQRAARAHDARGRALRPSFDRRLDASVGDDPLHLARADALRRREERRLLDRARRLALDRRQREAHHLADRREVVAREAREEREEVLRAARRRRAPTRSGLRLRRRLALAHARGRRRRCAARRSCRGRAARARRSPRARPGRGT